MGGIGKPVPATWRQKRRDRQAGPAGANNAGPGRGEVERRSTQYVGGDDRVCDPVAFDQTAMASMRAWRAGAVSTVSARRRWPR